jgi:hypothetical protein
VKEVGRVERTIHARDRHRQVHLVSVYRIEHVLVDSNLHLRIRSFVVSVFDCFVVKCCNCVGASSFVQMDLYCVFDRVVERVPDRRIENRSENSNMQARTRQHCCLSYAGYAFISPKFTHITHVVPDNRQRQALYSVVALVLYVRNDSNAHVKLLHQAQHRQR